MKRASCIIFDTLKRTSQGVRFFYEIDGVTYSFFHSLDWKKVTLDDSLVEMICAHVGLSFLMDISLICLPKKIVLKAIRLPQGAIAFWKKVYESMGMECLYVDRLPLECLSCDWTVSEEASLELNPFVTSQTGELLLAMSGGKESLTALKLFERMKVSPHLFFLQYPKSAIEPTYDLRMQVFKDLSRRFPFRRHRSDITNTQSLRRRFSCEQADGFDMGEIIFGALLYADQYEYIVIGNEWSSNFGNGKYQGREVNHQFVKSLELAKEINQYIHTYLHPHFTYFSPFFGYYEYPIGKIFCSDDRYFDIWNSCNRGTKKKRFCCECPKCAFTYILVLAFKDKSFLKNYFWRDPMENLELCKPLFEYDSSDKPLECVGEKKEVWLALKSIYEQKKDLSSPTIRYFADAVYPRVRGSLKTTHEELLKEHTDFQFIPPRLRPQLEEAFGRILN